MEYAGTTCLVTGASSGLGREFVRQLAARGATVIAVARREDRLSQLARELKTVYAYPCDLGCPTAVRDLKATLDSQGIFPDTLINCAGFSTFGAFADLDQEREAHQVAVNVAAVVELTGQFLPHMLDSGKGACQHRRLPTGPRSSRLRCLRGLRAQLHRSHSP